MRSGKRLPTAFLALVLSAATPVWTQLRPHDFTDRAEAIEERTVTVSVRPPLPAAESLRERRFPVETWEKERARLIEQRASVDTTRRRPMPRIESRQASIATTPREIVRAPQDQSRATIRHFDRIERPETATRFSDAPVVRIQPGRERIANLLATASLRDFNRFQFRRNRSDEEGIPVQQAGTPE